MPTGVQLAVEGYVDLARFLVKSWGDLASKIATHVDAGTLSADDAVADATEGGLLAVQTVVLVVNEAFDALAVLSGAQDRPHIARSQPFSVGSSSVGNGIRTLQIRGPLVADLGQDQLTNVTIVPATLHPGETTFHLEVDAAGHQAVGYSGLLDVLDQQGNVVESIAVWITL